MLLRPNVMGYVGLWGSGKTLAMSEEAIKRVGERDGRVVVGSNYGFTGSRYTVDLETLDDVVVFAATTVPGFHKLLLLDEIHMLARARGFAQFPPAADVVFTQGRKLGLSLLYTSQHWRYVDVNIRRITERVTRCAGWFPKVERDDEGYALHARPRLLYRRWWNAPDADKDALPAKHDGWSLSLFPWEAAASYDTHTLVKNAQLLMLEQHEASEAMREGLQALVRLGDYTSLGTSPAEE